MASISRLIRFLFYCNVVFDVDVFWNDPKNWWLSVQGGIVFSNMLADMLTQVFDTFRTDDRYSGTVGGVLEGQVAEPLLLGIEVLWMEDA